MSFSIEGKKCACCNAYLFPDDDVVFCPECGAPHHRSCYNHLGHCALEADHGTENQYKPEETVEKKAENKENDENNSFKSTHSSVMIKCPNCSNQYPVSEKKCPNCGEENRIPFGSKVMTFDFLGGVPEDFDIGEGVTAGEAKEFVLSNTHRFIPKFARMRDGSKASFNLLAFFFPGAWMLSRKMYKLGTFISALTIALNALVLPFYSAMRDVVPTEVSENYSSLALFVSENMQLFNKAVFFSAMVSGLLYLVLMFVVGIFGDYFYKKHVISSVVDIKENSEDREFDTRKRGGASLLLFILGVFATRYLPAIIASLAGL